MIECEPREGDMVEVTFTLGAGEDLGARAVAVVGDFNGWDPTANPMAIRADGRLAVTVAVPAGYRYAFRYLAENGQWLNDDAAHRYEPNDMGQDNSILDLTAGRGRPAPGEDLAGPNGAT